MIHQTGKPGKDLENFADTLYYSEEYLKFNENGFCSFIRFKDLSSDEVTVENIFSYHSRTGQRLMFAIHGRDSREIFRKVFRYGENGKIVREEITYPQKSSKVSDTVEYIYNETGNVVKKVTRKVSTGKERSVETFTYNANGAVSVRNIIYAGKEIKKVTEKYEYDADGRESVRETIDSGKTEKITTSYTEEGKIAEEIRTINGARQSRKVYHYENGICTAQLLSDSGDRLSSIIRLSYDSKGNWIRKVTYRFSENSKRIEVYQIEKRDISYRR